jgi:hypothetical protein
MIVLRTIGSFMKMPLLTLVLGRKLQEYLSDSSICASFTSVVRFFSQVGASFNRPGDEEPTRADA